MAATILAIPLAARAQPVTGPYVSLGVGWNYLQSQEIKGVSTDTTQFGNVGRSVNNKNINFGSGVVGLGAVGWGFGNGIRVEVEGNYRYNSTNQYGNGSNLNTSRSFVAESGGESKAGVMVNALYDFTDLIQPGITPYLGAGVGWQSITGGKTTVQGLAPGGVWVGQPFVLRSSGNQDAFAYQAIVGVSYTLASVDPGLALTLEYRFFGVGGDKSFTGDIIAPNGRQTPAKIGTGPEYNHAIIFGARYAFGRPPPPAPLPVAAPAPAPTRTYLVFFDWDRADLTDRARGIVREAAEASTHTQYTQIHVNGYTDKSGSAQYNQTLSVRRAQTVQGELVRDGVPQNAITIRGFGETNPLVPTADGVREPQNRRVEIVLQ
jgi:outer membrane protein OmpA-like peptidoglycan-associated protein